MPALRCFGLLCVLCVLRAESAAAEPCTSGLQPGQRPGPYAFVVSAGPQRGQSFCYICDTAQRPAVVIFARTLTEPLGKLAAGMDKALGDQKASELRSWVTFLSDDQPSLDAKVVQWAQKHALRSIPVGVFEDAGGPPSYRLNREADVTVLLFVKQKVVANFAFRAGELSEDKVSEVLRGLPKILPAK